MRTTMKVKSFTEFLYLSELANQGVPPKVGRRPPTWPPTTNASIRRPYIDYTPISVAEYLQGIQPNSQLTQHMDQVFADLLRYILGVFINQSGSASLYEQLHPFLQLLITPFIGILQLLGRSREDAIRELMMGQIPHTTKGILTLIAQYVTPGVAQQYGTTTANALDGLDSLLREMMASDPEAVITMLQAIGIQLPPGMTNEQILAYIIYFSQMFYEQLYSYSPPSQ